MRRQKRPFNRKICSAQLLARTDRGRTTTTGRTTGQTGGQRLDDDDGTDGRNEDDDGDDGTRRDGRRTEDGRRRDGRTDEQRTTTTLEKQIEVYQKTNKTKSQVAEIQMGMMRYLPRHLQTMKERKSTAFSGVAGFTASFILSTAVQLIKMSPLC